MKNNPNLPRLAIITTHPIQYNAPLFRLLSSRGRIDLKVFYTWGQARDSVYDEKFQLERSWDIPLLDGYPSVFLKNRSPFPNSNRFFGIINNGLLKKIKDDQYDAVLIYRWSVWSHFWLMQCIGKDTQLFFRGDSILYKNNSVLRSWLKNLYLRIVYRNVSKVFTVGELNSSYMKAAGFKEHQLIKAFHSVDNERFYRNAHELEIQAIAERKKIGIPDHSIVFQYAGKFYSVKRLDMLIRAFQQIPGTDIRLLLTGGGEDEEKLRKLASNDPRIIFQSFKNQSEMPWVYRMGDVFVLPSLRETWGLSVNEAMACGRPAIVSDYCGCAPDLIIEGKTGLIFHSFEELVSCMSRLKNSFVLQQMKVTIREHISQFNLEQIALSIEKSMTR